MREIKKILFSTAVSLSLSLSLALSFFYFFFYLPLALSLLRVLDTREFRLASSSYSPLDRASSRRAFVAPSSFILASSFEQSEAETRRVLLSRGLSQSHRRRCQVFLLFHLSFLSFSPLSTRQRNCTITLSVFALGALFSFSLVKSSLSRISLRFSCFFLYFCSYMFFLRNFLLFLSFYPPFSLFFSLFLCSLPSFSFLSICIPHA